MISIYGILMKISSKMGHSFPGVGDCFCNLSCNIAWFNLSLWVDVRLLLKKKLYFWVLFSYLYFLLCRCNMVKTKGFSNLLSMLPSVDNIVGRIYEIV